MNKAIRLLILFPLGLLILAAFYAATPTENHFFKKLTNTAMADIYCLSPFSPIPIPDAGGTTNTLFVPVSATIVDINISVEVAHTRVGDLIIQVSHNGTTVLLLDRPGVPMTAMGCMEDNITAVFDDEAAVAAETMCNSAFPLFAIDGNVIPTQALSAFDGMDMAGTWDMKISDAASPETGMLHDWCIQVSSPSTGCYTMLDNANGLDVTETGIADYESADWISTTQTTIIHPTAIVDYDATDSIMLNPGFHVMVGAVFCAFIDGCNGGLGGANLKEEENQKAEKE